MQFIDLHKQFELIEQDVRAGMDKAFAHKRFIMGEEVAELEKKLAEYTGVKHVLGCSSGTDALVIPLMAMNLKKTDAVFVPSFTFFASAESITLAGGTPVFVDSDEQTFNISVEDLKDKIEKTIAEGKLTPKGIILSLIHIYALDWPLNRIPTISGNRRRLSSSGSWPRIQSSAFRHTIPRQWKMQSGRCPISRKTRSYGAKR